MERADVANVALPESHGGSELIRERLRRGLGDIDECDARALSRERAHEGCADTRAAPGHEHSASRKIGIT